MASNSEPESSGYCAGDSESVEDSQRAEATTTGKTSILNVLKAPTPSDICRKRKIATIPPRNRSKRPRCSSNPGSVIPAQRVREFPNEQLKVSAGRIFCTACREELSTKKSTIDNHIASAKHSAGKERLLAKDRREKDIAEAFRQYDAEVHPSGETLPEAVRIYRVKVLCTFLKAGVPINKIPIFRDILEESNCSLPLASGGANKNVLSLSVFRSR